MEVNEQTRRGNLIEASKVIGTIYPGLCNLFRNINASYSDLANQVWTEARVLDPKSPLNYYYISIKNPYLLFNTNNNDMRLNIYVLSGLSNVKSLTTQWEHC